MVKFFFFKKRLVCSYIIVFNRGERDLFGFILDVYFVHVLPSSKGEFDRILNVCGDPGFVLWGSEEASDQCVQSLVKSSVDLEYRIFSK